MADSDNSSDKFYISTAIAYVNAPPHVGHALELIQADAIARYQRLAGKEVYFLTGTDEHGTKIQRTADEKGVTAQELVDENAALFQDLAALFGASNDGFVRTSSEEHKRGAQALWRKIEEAGKFYEKEYEGHYCSGCEAFVLEKDLVDGECPNHKRAPELLKEKNIFFRLSDYSEEILRRVESEDPEERLEIRPASRRNEFLSMLRDGLHDVSFSRPRKTLAWGVPVPGKEDDQVMYVWCDALSNYVTALGYADAQDADGADGGELFKKFWPADVHLIGKDIMRFHCGIWIGMLLAAELPLPKSVWIHGFVTSEGQKMSKSLGNVVDPVSTVEEWGVDPVRYFLLREIPTGDDGDFSRERFEVVYRDELQNTMGNLVRRVVAMTQKYFDGKVPEGDDEMRTKIDSSWADYRVRMATFDIKGAIEVMLELARHANAYVEENKPWALAKDPDSAERLAVVMGNLVRFCRAVGDMLKPIVPETAERVLEQVGPDVVVMREPLFPNLEKEEF
jgi:methionyl-tRNA synthetase